MPRRLCVRKALKNRPCLLTESRALRRMAARPCFLICFQREPRCGLLVRVDTTEHSSVCQTNEVGMKARWGEAEEEHISKIEELDSLLNLLDERQAPLIVELVHEDGSTMAIGVGADQSVLTFFDENNQSWAGIGDRSRDDEVLVFEFCGEPSEIPAEMALPPSVTRAAARSFFESGRRPDGIDWERDTC